MVIASAGRSRHSRRVVGAVAVGGAILGVGVPALPADAHPFGEPQTVELSAEGQTVTARWSAAPDDLLMLGGLVGALPQRREFVFETSPTAPPTPVGETDADRLTSSRELGAYLEGHITVEQDGVSCPVRISLDELVDTGAQLTFACAKPVTEVDVGVAMLTDVHEAYRTVAMGDGSTSPERALYTIDDDMQTWTFGVASASAASSMATAVWGGVAAVALAGAAFAVRAFRRRPAEGASSSGRAGR